MKLFIAYLVLCAVGISTAQLQDTPETAAAKAAHFEAVRRVELLIASAPAPVVTPLPRPVVMETSQHHLGLNVHDTAEVAAAKVAHYEAVREAAHATAVANATNRVPDSGSIVAVPVAHSVPSQPRAYSQSHGHQSSPSHYPSHHHPSPSHYPSHHHPSPSHYPSHHYPSHHHHRSLTIVPTTQHQLGVNVHDTPEVAAAKKAHFEAVLLAEQAAAASNPNDDGSYMLVPAPAISGPVIPAPVIPVAPVVHASNYLRDTPEVAAAKAAHLAELRRVEMTTGPRYVDHTGHYVPMAHQVMYTPVTYQHNIDYNRMVPIVAVPQTNQHKLGVNVHDTPEVAAAKAAHFEAVRRAQLIAAEDEKEHAFPHNNYYSNPTRNYGQVNF